VGPEHLVVTKPDTLIFLRRSNGERTFEARFPDVSQIAILGDTVVAGSDRQLVAFDANSGLPWWDGIRDWWFRLHVYAGIPAVPTPSNLWVQRTRCELLAPVLTADRVIAACEEGAVRAHDLATGEVLWERDLGGLTTDPVQTARGLLIATPDALLLLDPSDGSELERRELDQWAVRELAVTSDAIYVLTDTDELIALR
jgi:outer membrane protein assembly factor BamB